MQYKWRKITQISQCRQIYCLVKRIICFLDHCLDIYSNIITSYRMNHELHLHLKKELLMTHGVKIKVNSSVYFSASP